MGPEGGVPLLIWLAQNIRPDLSFTISKLGWNLQKAKYRTFEGVVKVGKKTRNCQNEVVILKMKEGRTEIASICHFFICKHEGGNKHMGYCVMLKELEGVPP